MTDEIRIHAGARAFVRRVRLTHNVLGYGIMGLFALSMLALAAQRVTWTYELHRLNRPIRETVPTPAPESSQPTGFESVG